MEKDFEPNILVFACNWCSYAGMDLAGTSRLQYPHNLKVIRVMCSGRINPVHILEAFANGADGVLVTGCHPGDCHYISGNYKTRRRIMLLERLLEQFGVEKERLRLEWVSASEGERFANIAKEFVEQIRKLGPNRIAEKLRKEVAVV
ncbi:MAG: hydrogenase iron-sulfur subunit [Nitrososphaerota archaeon]|nr:hydrogenase iron-sulfur subunit [Aigarchaeota archaeon]MDW8076497.1 hydrogenase iron-sulfur subunit [Nitrososphaerota archaeon]